MRSWCIALASSCALASIAVVAEAQGPDASDAGGPIAPAPPPETENPETDAAPPESEVSPEDTAAIEAALAADLGAADDTRGTTEIEPPAGAAPATPGNVLNPDISVVLGVAGAIFSDEDDLQTGGHDPSETGFVLQQLEVSIGAAVDPYFRFDANLVFSLFEVEIEEAYGTTLDLPAQLQVRAGQFLTRFGRLNATHPHAWDFVDQPFSLGRVFGGEGNRGLGVELSWLTPLPWYVELVVSSTDAAGGESARSFFGDDDLGVDGPLDLQYTAAIEQFFPLSDDWSLLWGLSAALGPNSTGRDNRTEVYGTDLYLKYRPVTEASDTVVTFQTEWMYRRRQVPLDVLSDVSGYAQAMWKFARRWSAAGRYELGTPAVGLDGDVAQDWLDPEWTDARHRATANLTFYPTEFSRLRLQGSIDVPEWRDEPIFAAFLAMELVAGAHGAHEF